MVKRQCVAINSARRSSVFCFFGKLSALLNPTKADHDRQPMASVGLYQLSTAADLIILTHMCTVVPSIAKNISLSSEFIYFRFFTLFALVRTALFP